MIIEIVPTRATCDAVRNLTRHLLDKPWDNDDISTIMGSRDDVMDCLSDAERFNRKSCMQQFILTSKEDITSQQVKRTVQALMSEFGFMESDIALAVRHQKARYDAAGCDRHWHLLVRNVNPESGKTMKMSHSFARGEKVARTLESEFGFQLVNGKHNRAVLNAVDDDLRERLAGLADMPEPTAAYTKSQHQRAKRSGISMPEIRAFMRSAWTESNGSWSSFKEAVGNRGFHMCCGTRKPDVVVLADSEGNVIGSVTRLTGIKVADIKNAMNFDKVPPTPAAHVDIANGAQITQGAKQPSQASSAAISRPVGHQVHRGQHKQHETHRIPDTGVNLRVKGMSKEQIQAIEVKEALEEQQRKAVATEIAMWESIASSWNKPSGWADIYSVMQRRIWPDSKVQPWPIPQHRDKYDVAQSMVSIMKPAWATYQSSRKSLRPSVRRGGSDELLAAMKRCRWNHPTIGICLDDVISHNDIGYTCGIAASKLVAARKREREAWSRAPENRGRLADLEVMEQMAKDIHSRRDRERLARFLSEPRRAITDHRAAQAAVIVAPPPPPTQASHRVRRIGPSMPSL
ncbi:relaxase/mobilization nuclease domain-containing protein [Gluconacetobacter tumulicola]|uniref:MobA/VirD2-like nuclease domain-containing protein n=1 Tax=Gluconacetobacter tumulicola TaxID=1017177 RepID=A0A7W4JEU9_9PROT|nr:hypothetical protein [Gluconacetobacter tumulicola]MBB2179916.1 hypothetical protein [Gluconacetobacter tumulicola]